MRMPVQANDGRGVRWQDPLAVVPGLFFFFPAAGAKKFSRSSGVRAKIANCPLLVLREEYDAKEVIKLKKGGRTEKKPNKIQNKQTKKLRASDKFAEPDEEYVRGKSEYGRVKKAARKSASTDNLHGVVKVRRLVKDHKVSSGTRKRTASTSQCRECRIRYIECGSKSFPCGNCKASKRQCFFSDAVSLGVPDKRCVTSLLSNSVRLVVAETTVKPYFYLIARNEAFRRMQQSLPKPAESVLAAVIPKSEHGIPQNLIDLLPRLANERLAQLELVNLMLLEHDRYKQSYVYCWSYYVLWKTLGDQGMVALFAQSINLLTNVQVAHYRKQMFSLSSLCYSYLQANECVPDSILKLVRELGGVRRVSESMPEDWKISE